MDKTVQSKLAIRQELKKRRSGLSEENRKKSNLLITDKVVGHNFFYKAKKVLIYMSYKDEVDTTEIIEECFRQKKEVYVPKVIGDRMIFKQIHHLNQVVSGYQNILEPLETLGNYEYEASDFKDTLIIIPGLGFDQKLNRIGYGKGFYDKFLSDYPFSMKMAIAFDEQLIEELPADELDIKMDVIITSKLNFGGYYA